jgi:hypothetical protein
MHKIEIFEKATGTVIGTKEVKDLKAWDFYWTKQCDTENYDYRVVQPEVPTAQDRPLQPVNPKAMTEEDAAEVKKLRGNALAAEEFIRRKIRSAINTGANVFAEKDFKHNQKRLETFVAKIANILAKYK